VLLLLIQRGMLLLRKEKGESKKRKKMKCLSWFCVSYVAGVFFDV